MSTGIKSDDFAARLRRIEEKRQQNAAAETQKTRKPVPVSKDDLSGLRNALIGTILAIMLGTGGYVAWKLGSTNMLGSPAGQSSGM